VRDEITGRQEPIFYLKSDGCSVYGIRGVYRVNGGGDSAALYRSENMRKVVLCVIPLMMVLLGCASGGTATAGTSGGPSGMDLDAAIKEAAARMGENLPGGTKVALVSVASSSAQLSEYVISRLEAALVSGKKLVVVDRAKSGQGSG
jgi:hypothetical protein